MAMGVSQRLSSTFLDEEEDVRGQNKNRGMLRTMGQAVRSEMITMFENMEGDKEDEKYEIGRPKSAIEEKLLLFLGRYERISLLEPQPMLGRFASVLYALSCFAYFRGYSVSMGTAATAMLVVLFIAAGQGGFARKAFGIGKILLVKTLRLGLAGEDLERHYADEIHDEEMRMRFAFNAFARERADDLRRRNVPKPGDRNTVGSKNTKSGKMRTAAVLAAARFSKARAKAAPSPKTAMQVTRPAPEAGRQSLSLSPVKESPRREGFSEGDTKADLEEMTSPAVEGKAERPKPTFAEGAKEESEPMVDVDLEANGIADEDIFLQQLGPPPKDVKKVLDDATDAEKVLLQTEGLSPAGTTDIAARAKEIMQARRYEFFVSFSLQVVLIVVWVVRNALIRSGWESIISWLSLVFAIATAIPFQAQIAAGLCVIEITGMLVSTDLERFRDVLLSSLLDEELEPAMIVREISLAQACVRRRFRALNRCWTGRILSFLAAQFVLAFFYVFLAFSVVDNVGSRDVAIIAQITLIVIAALTIWNITGVLKLVARPGDRWAEIVSTDLSQVLVLFASQRVFGEYGGLRDTLMYLNFGFMLNGILITSKEVTRVSGALMLAIGVAIFEKFG